MLSTCYLTLERSRVHASLGTAIVINASSTHLIAWSVELRLRFLHRYLRRSCIVTSTASVCKVVFIFWSAPTRPPSAGLTFWFHPGGDVRCFCFLFMLEQKGMLDLYCLSIFFSSSFEVVVSKIWSSLLWDATTFWWKGEDVFAAGFLQVLLNVLIKTKEGRKLAKRR